MSDDRGMTAPESFLEGRVVLHRGDCLDVLATMPEASIDAVVTDPPYHLQSIVKRFGSPSAAPAQANGPTGVYGRSAAGFMGKVWDGGDVAFRPETWAAVLRVLKPGGHAVVFGGTRTWHRVAVAVEDAGFEIRDTLAWLYGSGFPKSHNLKGEWSGWGTALKPAFEPIILARKPIVEGSVAANVQRHGTGALNVDGCRVPSGEAWNLQGDLIGGELVHALGGGLNNSGRSGSHALGRWPANVVHDGSDEVLGSFPEATGQQGVVTGREPSRSTRNIFGLYNDRAPAVPRAGAGSAARFFYSAKADAEDRLGSHHPTVKPVDLMQWLVRLVTPPDGTALDPFAGTGTTGEATWREGFRAVLIEREAEYAEDIRRRMALAPEGRRVRRSASIRTAPATDLPLFQTPEAAE